MASALELPPISTSILADVEQAAVELGVTRDQMTEAAARAAAALSRKLLDNQIAGANIVGLCGNGVKGCVALHTLRILHGFGAECSAVLVGGERDMRPETAAAASVCEALRLDLLQPRSPAVRTLLADADLVIDGLVGVGLDGAPKEPLASLIRLCNEVRAQALSIECPSGLEPDSGDPLEPTLKARNTLALGLPAAGLFADLAWQYTGELWLCDIGYPPAALEAAGLDGEGLFEPNEMLRLR
ncbi:MAG TPA: NAD(P)H-hydrate epimerase [Myxococcales bacterium]|jgi:NAD(P)H-hydrate epimerase|nr:NAD(P)H-hydrate epimerase [Myxococcales bacterium]